MSDVKVPEGWSEYTLKNISTVITKGTTPTTTGAGYEQSGVNFIRVENISKSGFIDDSDLKYISQKTHDALKRSQLQDGDLLVSIAGAIGRAAIVRSKNLPANTNQAVGIVRLIKNKIVADFVRYSIESPFVAQQINNSQAGNAQVNLNLEQLGGLRLYCPPLPEQQKIATILTSVDTVIEKTRAQIDKLKHLKTAMMQELLTKGIGHTEFKDSPVGKIPKGWEVVELGSISKLERGRFSHRPRNDPQFYGGHIPFLQTGDIPKETPRITSFSQTLNEKGLKISKLFPAGTLVITIAATIGEIGILEFDSCFPDSLVGIKVDQKKAEPMFVLYLMRYLKNELESLAPQTAQKNINLDILQPFEVPLPPLTEQKLIANSMNAIDTKIEKLSEKLERMKNTKKALMQDLLTGKVRV